MRVALLLCVYAALGWSALAARCAFALCAVGSVHASDNDCVMMCSGLPQQLGVTVIVLVGTAIATAIVELIDFVTIRVSSGGVLLQWTNMVG